jgi:hypothetical protein
MLDTRKRLWTQVFAFAFSINIGINLGRVMGTALAHLVVGVHQ